MTGSSEQRSPDKHLDADELDALVSSKALGLNSDDWGGEPAAAAVLHTESCSDCRQKVAMHKSVQNALSGPRLGSHQLGSLPPGKNCPDDSQWPSVAAGLLPQNETRELMKHAAQCDHCGPLLRAAAETLSEDVTPNEEELLASLRSASQKWRAKMADDLKICAAPPEKSAEKNSSGRSAGKTGSWLTNIFSWPNPAFAAAAVAIAVVAVTLGVRTFRPPNAEQLLAQAYTERRTLEPRIAGARYAPMRVERGPGGSNLDKPAALLKAEALIGENLQKTPNDPAWLQARSRADLLDGNYDSAIKTLQRALETQPDAPSLLTDLGSAYYLRAQATDRPIDYGNAIENLGKALAKSPDDPIALYNQALACEQLFLYTQAIDDWQHYLRLDPQSEWADEARKRLAAVQEIIKKHADRVAEPLLTPEQIAKGKDDPAVLEKIDERVEDYLNEALNSWIPAMWNVGNQSNSLEPYVALQELSEMLRTKHEDTWLADFLQDTSIPQDNAAVHDLIASEKALIDGRYGLGVDLGQRAVSEFEKGGNRTGALRASLALMDAQAFALDFTGCLVTASRVLPALSQHRYQWLQASILLQRGECLGGITRPKESLHDNRRALHLAENFHYPELVRRAEAFDAGYMLISGREGIGLRHVRDGLLSFWQLSTSNSSGKILYASLSDFADTSEWVYMDECAWTELLHNFPPEDPVDQALWTQFLAGAQRKAGDYKAAIATLQGSSAKMFVSPNDGAAILRLAEVLMDEAEVQLDAGNANAAINSLSQFRERFEAASSGQFRANYFKILGEAYLALGKTAEAENLLDKSLSVIEAGMRDLHRETDRLAWSRSRGQIYRDLLAVKQISSSPIEAFSWWEGYKGASLRTDSSFAELHYPKLFRFQAPLGSVTENSTLLSYAILRNSILAFSYHQGVLKVRSLPLPRDLESLARTFFDLCADPSSDVSILNARGRRLYEILLSPIESEIQGSRSLRIETDGILDLIPFDLLTDFHDHYLRDNFELTFSHGIAYGVRTPNRFHFDRTSSALVVVSPGTEDASLPALPDATEEGREVARLFNGATLLSGRKSTRLHVLEELRSAQVFHFAGHATAKPDRVGLELGRGELLKSDDFVDLPSRNLKLAVLSACDTANGERETPADLNSLARSLAAAGVREVVASRWNVDSVVTRQLMQKFYSSLLSGETTTDSLSSAAAYVRRLPAYQHPYFWASFAVFGSS